MRCTTDGALTTWYWDGRFWQWNGGFYEAIGDDQLIDRIWKFLDEAKLGTERMRFRPRPRDVDEVLKALRSAISIDPKVTPPAWIGPDHPDYDPRSLLVFRNMLVDIKTGDPLPLNRIQTSMNRMKCVLNRISFVSRLNRIGVRPRSISNNKIP